MTIQNIDYKDNLPEKICRWIINKLKAIFSSKSLSMDRKTDFLSFPYLKIQQFTFHVGLISILLKSWWPSAACKFEVQLTC
jgi:hypothetical protein